MNHVTAYVRFFESLSPATLSRLDELFCDDARFVDPFNDVRGLVAIRRVFEHMFARCAQPRFLVDEQVGDGTRVYLRWRFTFGTSDRRHTISGVSRVAFDDAGRASEHVDYWDPAAQLYEKAPLVGGLFRALRRRLAAPEPTPIATTRRDAVATER